MTKTRYGIGSPGHFAKSVKGAWAKIEDWGDEIQLIWQSGRRDRMSYDDFMQLVKEKRVKLLSKAFDL